jgi:hypothetical protein
MRSGDPARRAGGGDLLPQPPTPDDHQVLRGMADAVASVPSTDGFPVTVLEASACSAALVVSDLPYCKEWFVDGGMVLDFPVTPVAGEFKIASLATLGTADFVEMVPAAPLDASPVPVIPIGRAPTLTVLRL